MADRDLSPQQTNALVPFLRMIWMLGGPFGAGLLIALVALDGGGVSWRDVAVGLCLFGTAAIRYVDIAFLRGETGDGRPATMQDFWRYAVPLVVGGVGAWGLVRWMIG
jgi:hypothetical protein